MSRRLIAVTLGAALFACAGAEKKEEAKDTEAQQKVENVTYFDVAACYPRKPEVPDVVTQEVIIGELLAARPQIMECMVPPSARGPANVTNMTTKLTVSVDGPAVEITSDNLTPEGEQCIREAILAATAQLKLPAPKAEEAPPAKKGKKPAAPPPPPQPPAPVSGEMQYVHDREHTPAVVMGVNASSDMLGTVRLLMPKSCDCFAEWKESPPRSLKAQIVVSHVDPTKDSEGKEQPAPETVPPSEVTFEPVEDAKATAVQTCLHDKLMQTQFANPTGKLLKIPGVPFYFIHSAINEPLDPSVDGYYRFVHLDAIRSQRNADTAIALGLRTQKQNAYADLVNRYKASGGKAWQLITPLTNTCQELIKADDAWAAALEGLVKVDTQTVELTGELATRDPAWTEVQAKAQATVEQSKKDLEQAKAFRQQDEAACPKTKK